MSKATLVIMAAGIGSRFGGGIKQLEPVGPNGEIIIDYSIYDALEAGFDKVVFVIRKDLEVEFKEKIGKRIEEKVEVEYVYQEVADIPHRFKRKFIERSKPWGTGQAILCCKGIVNEPFMVINADDYYGKKAYVKVYDYLMNQKAEGGKLSICMVGFLLENTLSENGGVTRGICEVNKDNILKSITETHNIVKTLDGAEAVNGDDKIIIDLKSQVSMNMWGFTPDIFGVLEEGFEEFLNKLDEGEIKSEYLLPTIIGDLLTKDMIEVKVLQSTDKWFGVTYKEDKDLVVSAIRTLVSSGGYMLLIS